MKNRMQYFVVMVDYGRRGREAVVDPEITRREVISRVVSGEYKNISFIHQIADSAVDDITAEILAEAAMPEAGTTGADRQAGERDRRPHKRAGTARRLFAIGIDQAGFTDEHSHLLLARPERPALLAGYAGWYHQPLDAGAMNAAAAQLLGTHDFSAFRAAECQALAKRQREDRHLLQQPRFAQLALQHRISTQRRVEFHESYVRDDARDERVSEPAVGRRTGGATLRGEELDDSARVGMSGTDDRDDRTNSKRARPARETMIGHRSCHTVTTTIRTFTVTRCNRNEAALS